MAKSNRELAYYRTRLKNRVHSKILDFFVEEMKSRGVTKKEVAELLNKEPAQISRWLSQPSNLTLETISDLLLALDAELKPIEIVRFADIPARQYAHPLIARATGVEVQRGERTPRTATSGAAHLRTGASDSGTDTGAGKSLHVAL